MENKPFSYYDEMQRISFGFSEDEWEPCRNCNYRKHVHLKRHKTGGPLCYNFQYKSNLKYLEQKYNESR